MLEKVYKSNVCKVWPFKRQDALIAKKLNDSSVLEYVDELTPDERRKHKKEFPERENMLRSTTRKVNERINFASFAAAAPTAEDFAVVLSKASYRGSFLRDLNADIEVKSRKDWTKAFEAFRSAKIREAESERGRNGGLRSAEIRGVKVKEAANACRVEWPLYNYSSLALAKKHGVSVGGLKAILGSRRIARQEHNAAMKRKAKKDLNKCLNLK
jgi:hypothetical protein